MRRRSHPASPTARRPSGLAWGLIAALALLLLLLGMFSMWNALAGWLAPEPTASSAPEPPPAPTVTRAAPPTPTLAATKTLAPDLIPATPSPLPSLPFLPQKLPPNVNPITGMIAPDPALLERRPIAVKVTNFPRYVRAWQSGLSLADNVYEYYLEEGLTRFVAVYYQTDASRVGPVRSARFFDEHVARMYHAILVFGSADERVREYLFATDLKYYLITPNDLNCPPLCRDDRIDDYNNYFLDTSKMSAYLAWRGTDNGRPALSGMAFSILPPFSTRNADRIYTQYSDYDYNYWQYDPLTQKYLRFQETVNTDSGKTPTYAAHVDNLTGKQIDADNVVVLLVRHIHNPQSTGEMYVFDLYNSGKAFLFRDGRAYEARWVRTAFDALLSFTDPGGSPLPLKPGVTWFQVIGLESAYSSEGNDWFFDFRMP